MFFSWSVRIYIYKYYSLQWYTNIYIYIKFAILGGLLFNAYPAGIQNTTNGSSLLHSFPHQPLSSARNQCAENLSKLHQRGVNQILWGESVGFHSRWILFYLAFVSQRPRRRIGIPSNLPGWLLNVTGEGFAPPKGQGLPWGLGFFEQTKPVERKVPWKHVFFLYVFVVSFRNWRCL